jgi:hypothetical protein
MHDIISDIIDWDQANKAYLAGEGQSGERYIQRLEAADRMAEIEARWHHLPGGFLSERKLIKAHIQAVAESTQAATNEEVCWLAIAAATAWIPQREPVETALPRKQAGWAARCRALPVPRPRRTPRRPRPLPAASPKKRQAF